MPFQDWDECKGSKPGRRGYTCGLWMLLHSLAANTQPEHSGGAFWMTAVRCDCGLHHIPIKLTAAGSRNALSLPCGCKDGWYGVATHKGALWQCKAGRPIHRWPLGRHSRPTSESYVTACSPCCSVIIAAESGEAIHNTCVRVDQL